MQALAQRLITEEEYWRMEKYSTLKHEYFRGQMYAMAGASRRHNVIASNALTSLGSQLKGERCRAVGSDQRAKVEATGLQTYPDIAVYCPPARFDSRQPDTLLEPTVLSEVLSPATAEYDRTGKFDHFKQIPTLRDYLLIAQDRRRIEHLHRGQNDEWILTVARASEEMIAFDNIGCTLALSDVYDGVDLPPELDFLREQVEG